MPRTTPYLIALSLALLLAANAAASVTYSEPAGGFAHMYRNDSPATTTPTPLPAPLTVGKTIITGNAGAYSTNDDFFSFTIPTGLQVTATLFTANSTFYFSTYHSVTTPSGTSFTSMQLGQTIDSSPAKQHNLFDGGYLPLQPGTYAILLAGNDFSSELPYQVTLTTTPAPPTAWLLLPLAAAMLCRRRRPCRPAAAQP